jgi:hypothetical protein
MNNARRKKLKAIYQRVDDLNGLLSNVKYLADELRSDLQDECDGEEESYGNLPESLQNGDKGQAMQEAIDTMQTALSALEEVANVPDLDEAMEALDNAQAAGQ